MTIRDAGKLAELAKVRRMAAEVADSTDRLDVLVSNAGSASTRWTSTTS
jgi:NAD(P)-dependent dehydrogenase (short-subunit alcohol dehydrogenase family)